MKYTPNNLKSGTRLWYRKKGSWDIDSLVVCETRKDRFVCLLSDGRYVTCSYKYASNRLFRSKDALSTKTEKIEMERTYGGWSGKASYSTEFNEREFGQLLQKADQKQFED